MKPVPTQAGFSLIEMIVSLALFSVVMTISIGALLVLIASNQQMQKEQSVMTNLSFALDSMAREIRTGSNYYCDSRNAVNAGPNGRKLFNGTALDSDRTQDCVDGNVTDLRFHGLAFVEGGQSISGMADTKIVYFYNDDPDNDNSTEDGALFRRVSGQAPQSIVSSGIVITDAQFYVTGSARGDTNQAMVTVYLEAKEADDPTGKVYEIQTTITQRALDI